VAAEVLEGFVKVHQVYMTEVLAKKAAEKALLEGKTLPEAEALGLKVGSEEAATEAKANEIKSGESLGSFSFTATGE
jgi:peptide subunit release factor 1 (eRF1)